MMCSSGVQRLKALLDRSLTLNLNLQRFPRTTTHVVADETETQTCRDFAAADTSVAANARLARGCERAVTNGEKPMLEQTAFQPARAITRLHRSTSDKVLIATRSCR